MGDIDVAASAAYEARARGPHEIGTWPAFRDGYAAGLAARTPGPAALSLATLIEQSDPDWLREAAIALAAPGQQIDDVVRLLDGFAREVSTTKGAGGDG